MTLDMMKQRQKELGYSDERMAILTDTARTTFHRRWHSDGQSLPHDFVMKCCLVLGLSMDEDERTPTDNSTIKLDIKESDHEEIMRIFAERLNDKQEQIDELTLQNEKLRDEISQSHTLFHELNKGNIVRIDKMTAESKEREDRKNKIIQNQFRLITLLAVIASLFAGFLVYFVIDAFNGDWGLVRYDELREIIGGNDASESGIDKQCIVSDGVIGLEWTANGNE